jgi:hypothetical protein
MKLTAERINDNPKEEVMRKEVLALALLMFLAVQAPAFGQSSNATIGGTVSDPTGALIPGVTVTATNDGTGVASSTVSNETGTYNIPSLLPGVYTVRAELPAFQTQTYTQVRLGNAAQVRLNFTMQVAAVATGIEVTIAADRLLVESSSSVGQVLAERTVSEMPIVSPIGNDVLSLTRLLPGVSMTTSPIFGANDTLLAGVSAANVQIQRDGVEASAGGRWTAGINSATVMNPDLVGEIRMILAPVDAEVGRGNSQIQVQTRSGTNQFRGAAAWNIQNTALDPNTWANNRVQPEPATRPWRNVHEYTVSAGGPIVRNKTFFFALWNGLLPKIRENINANILTPCARRGIFRYFDNWSNGNVNTVTNRGTTPVTAVVDSLGNPVVPTTNPNGTPFTGTLRYASVFGPLRNTPTRPDCSDAVVDGAPWDPYRTRMDPTGYMTKLLDVMPLPNNYEVGDGLNTAGYRWVLGRTGADNRFGIGEAVHRKQINIKIDHNFTSSHKINGGYSYERNHAANTWGVWPFRFPGAAYRRPQVLTLNFTSTLSPTLLNEARFGMRRTGTNTPTGMTNPELDGAAIEFFPSANSFPVLPQLGAGAVCVCGGQPFGTRGGGAGTFPGDLNESTPLYTYANTLSWTRSTHSFKGGVEYRFASSRLSIDTDSNDFSTFARAFGGETNRSVTQGINTTNMPGLAGTATTGNNAAMRNLLQFLSGSLSRVTQLYFIGSAERLNQWDDYQVSTQRTRELNQREFAAFFKDDWKATRDLTLNLGVRWDYYGVPWVSDGLTASPLGGGDALFGYSGRGYDDWMRPGQRGDSTELAFVGPGSPNPNMRPWQKDFNNIGPAIGFAWQVPWFGAGQTTVRGGYQVSYLLGGGRFSTLEGPLANPPGSSYNATIDGGPGELEYLDLTDLQRIVPVPVPVAPMLPIPVTARNVNLTAFDSNYVTPYVQNLTLAVTRNLGRNLTMDLKYVGTLSRKLYGSMNLNIPNFLDNGLIDAFDAARAGGESELLNRMLNGINLAGNGFGPVGTVFNGVPQTGALHLRSTATSSLRNALANGNYQTLANTLDTINYSKAGGQNATLPDIPQGVNGAVLRNSGMFPENFIRTNPQFGTATLQSNLGNANYHSMQAQLTLRPVNGFSYQGTYTWSKNLGRTGGFTNPADRGPDYTLQAGHRAHDFRSMGTFELPFGPGQLLLRNSSGPLARIVEGWQMSWFLNLSSGAPTSISAQSMLYASGVPDIVGPFNPEGKVQWEDGAISGNYFGGAYTQVADPQCARVASAIRSLCTLDAIADASGNVVLQNPLPGTRGTLGLNTLEMPGTWTFDAAMRKVIRLTERKRLEFRLDASNLFNHPQPANPTLDINSATPLGNIASKAGNRQFQATMRLEF